MGAESERKDDGRGDHELFWDSIYSSDNSFFGEEPSVLAKESIQILRKYGCKTVLELGCGQGRDTLYFAKEGFNVAALDCSKVSISHLEEKLGHDRMLRNRVRTYQVDIEKGLLQESELMLREMGSIDAVYSHLFFCMPFTDGQLEEIFRFVDDTLGENGLHIFSIRDKREDTYYGKGMEIGIDTFEVNGFKVRFFDGDNIRKFLGQGFKLVKMEKAHEEPCSLLFLFLIKQHEW
jgi:SAM-dependent methyltransferase